MSKIGPRFYPAAWSAALTAALAALVAFHVFDQKTASYVAASGTAVLGVATAALSRPVLVPAVSAALGTFLTSLAGFGLHLSSDQIAGVMGLAAAIGVAWVHPNVVPAAGSPSLLDPRLHPLAHQPSPAAMPGPPV